MIAISETLLINAGGTFYREATEADFRRAISDKRFPILELNVEALKFLKNNDLTAISSQIDVARLDEGKVFYSNRGTATELTYTITIERATGQSRPKGVPASGTIFITPLFPPATRQSM